MPFLSLCPQRCPPHLPLIPAHLGFRCCCCSIAKLYLFCDPMDCSPLGPSVHGIAHARILERVPISFFRGSSGPRDWASVSWIGRRILYSWAPEEAPASFSHHWAVTYYLHEQIAQAQAAPPMTFSICLHLWDLRLRYRFPAGQQLPWALLLVTKG